MASLTPGVLSKLIENAGNKDFKVTGEHRSPILQVLEIVPSLPGAGDDQHDPWRSRGFFLKVSDSLHSAYASLSDEDLDLIYSDKIQLGQFVHVSRLDSAASGSRVPILRGLKPVSKRRPCVGNPTDLVSSDALPIGCGGGFSKRPAKSKSQTKGKSAGDGVKPKKLEPSRRVLVAESRRLSLDSARRGWDQGLSLVAAVKSISSPMRGCDKKASSENKSAKPPKFSPLKTKDETSPLQKPKSNVVKRKDVKSPVVEAAATRPIPVPLDLKTGSEKKIAWRTLPSTMAVAGKRAVRSRNHAFMAAVHALEEASATDAVLHCMCSFAELCECSKEVSAGSLAEQFLQLNQRIQQTHSTLNSLLKRKPSTDSTLDNSSHEKNATSWVQAAIATNLSEFKLFQTKDKLEAQTPETQLYVVIENATKKLDFDVDSPKPSPTNRRSNHPSDSSIKQSPSSAELCSKREELCKGSGGLEEAAKLAEKLLSVSRRWFVKYLEGFLGNGFGVSVGEEGAEIVHLLRQLKRVNQWMNELIESEVEIDDRMEQLKKKLYRFLLEHVDMAARSSR